MMRFLVFAGENYYPRGGWNDFRQSLETEEQARLYAQKLGVDWWHIIDGVTGKQIGSGGKGQSL